MFSSLLCLTKRTQVLLTQSKPKSHNPLLNAGIETPAPPLDLLDSVDTVNLASEDVAPLAIAVTLTGTIGLPTVPMVMT